MKRIFVLFMAALLVGPAAWALSREETASAIRTYLVSHYGSVAASPLATGILYDLVLPLSHIESVDGGASCDTVSLSRFVQIAYELRRAAIGEPLVPDWTFFREQSQRAARDGVIPIAVLDFRLNRIAAGYPRDGALRFLRSAGTALDTTAFVETSVFSVAPLAGETYHGARTVFAMEGDSLYFTNQHATQRLWIDFDDGQGWRAVSGPEIFEIHYSKTGVKTLQLRAVDDAGRGRVAKVRFQVNSLDTPDPTQTWPLRSHQPFHSQYGNGTAYVYLADGHSTLTRPLLFAEGFDLDNTAYWDELYTVFNEQNLLDTLHDRGYDIMVLNYTDATAELQRNAYVAEALLDTLDQLLPTGQTIAAVGRSMSGLILRYALTEMEADSQHHRVRTLITHDSPHRGATLPLGLQYWMDFFADESAEAAAMRAVVNSPAARQLLLTHYTSPPTATAAPDTLFGLFANELQGLGAWPTQPRLVSIVNGSANRTGQGFSPGTQLVLYEYTSLPLDITGDIWALNNGAAQMVFYGLIDMMWPLPDTTLAVTVAATAPWDNAPGGKLATMAQMDTMTASYGDIIALHPAHCFVPTISALDLPVTDPFFNIAGATNLDSLSVFDTLYFQAQNQDHVKITAQNAEWFLAELADSLPPPSAVPTQPVPVTHALLEIYPNPFNATATIAYTLAVKSPLTLRVYNVQGREVALIYRGIAEAGPHHVEFDSQPLASGIYWAWMETEQVSVAKKLVVLK